MVRWFNNWFFSIPVVNRVIRLSRKIVLPGFGGTPLFDVAWFFFRGLTEGYVTTRAAAISYSVFLAIFPFLIFLFSIIPFIPLENFQTMLLGIMQDFIPRPAWESVKDTITDIITMPRSSLLLLNLALTLYFSTNGVNSLIAAINNTFHNVEGRQGIRQYFTALLIVLINSILLIIAIGLMTFGPQLLEIILPDFIGDSSIMVLLLNLLRWSIILLLLLTAIYIVFSMAPAKRQPFGLISPGSILATTLIILTTLGFNFYVENFSSYNAFYGSLGTLMIVLVWIYINALSLILGFELNASILAAGRTGKESDQLRLRMSQFNEATRNKSSK